MAATPQARNAALVNAARQPAQAYGARPTNVTSALASISRLLEHAGSPGLPDGFWRMLGASWYFVAGITLGVLVALVMTASASHKPRLVASPFKVVAAPSGARVVEAATNARVLVVDRPAAVAERGAVEANPEAQAADEIEPAAIAEPPRAPMLRRVAVVAPRKPAGGRMPSGADLLSAGL